MISYFKKHIGHRVHHESMFAALGLTKMPESILIGITNYDIHNEM